MVAAGFTPNVVIILTLAIRPPQEGGRWDDRLPLKGADAKSPRNTNGGCAITSGSIQWPKGGPDGGACVRANDDARGVAKQLSLSTEPIRQRRFPRISIRYGNAIFHVVDARAYVSHAIIVSKIHGRKKTHKHEDDAQDGDLLEKSHECEAMPERAPRQLTEI